jgi:hypothetical protein
VAATGFGSMITDHRETTDGHCKVSRKSLEPVFEPLHMVVASVPQQERATNTARHAVVQSGQGRINQLSSSHGHRGSPGGMPALCVIPLGWSTSSYLLVPKNHHRDRLSSSPWGGLALKCVSFHQALAPFHERVPRLSLTTFQSCGRVLLPENLVQAERELHRFRPADADEHVENLDNRLPIDFLRLKQYSVISKIAAHELYNKPEPE